MRAATIRDGQIAVEEHPDPNPQTGELLVRVRAAGLNGADMMQLAGRYPAPPGAPQDIPGLELAGERLLVHGAAGGVGSAAVQLGTMAGARVTATVRDEHCREQVTALGVNAIAPDEFVEAGPFDVILELVGAPNWAGNVEALALRGPIVFILVGAGARTEVDLRALMMKRATVLASTMRARSLEEKAAATRLVEKAVLPGFVSGDLAVPVAATYPLDDVAAAYERFKAGS